MNLILLFREDLINSHQAQLRDRRLEHINAIHKAKVGDRLTVGLVNGETGFGIISYLTKSEIILDLTFNSSPPPALPVTLVLALPRPNMLKRSLQTCATMGVKQLILLGTQRVEKSYWQSPQLSPENIQHNLILGLEQAKDTFLPTVQLEKNFNYFIKEKYHSLCQNKRCLVAHPNSANACPSQLKEETVLFIGPEGGFVDGEIAQLSQHGCERIHIGKRILRVETAVPVLLAKLFD